MTSKVFRRYRSAANGWSGIEGVMDYFLCVVGMVLFLEGLPYVAFPLKMKKWIEKMLEMQPAALRSMGLLLMIIGLCLVYVGRR